MQTGDKNRLLTPLQIYWKNILHLYDINYLQLSNLVSTELSDELKREISWVYRIMSNSQPENNRDSIGFAPKFKEFLEFIKRIERKSNKKGGKGQQRNNRKPDYFEFKQLVALRELHSEMDKRNIQAFSKHDKNQIQSFLDTVGKYQSDGEPIINCQCYNRNIMKINALPKNSTIDLVREALMLVLAKRKPKISRKEVRLADAVRKYGWKQLIFTDLEFTKNYDYEFGFDEDREQIEEQFEKIIGMNINSIDKMEILFEIFNKLVEILKKEKGFIIKHKDLWPRYRDDAQDEYRAYDYIISSHIVYFLRWIRVVPEEELRSEVFQIIEDKMINKSRSYFISWNNALSQPEKNRRFVECKESKESLLLQADFSNIRHIVLEVINGDDSFGDYMQEYFDQVRKT